jgi:hypothetical protein
MADIVIRNLPEDVRKVILQEQLREKKNRGTNQFSMSSTIIKIIREWKNNCRKEE